jgi:sulfonate transport system substrate-binding protein
MSNRLLLAGALALALSATQATAQVALIDAPPPLNPPVKLTIGAVKVPHVAPFMRVADLARPLGVEVEVVNFVRYADVRTALASGSIEIGSIGPADVPIAVSQNLRGIVGLYGVGVSAKNPIVRNGVTLNTWEDLYGKRVAIAPGSAVWFQFAATVTEAGINYGRLNIVNIQGGGMPFVQAMQRGDIDLFLGWEPFESMAVQQGHGFRQTALDYSRSRAVGAELGMVGATRAAVDGKREAVRRLVFAYLQAQNEMSASKQALATGIAGWTGLSEAVSREVADRMTLEQSLTLAQIQAQAKEFHRLGVLQRDVSGEMPQFFDQTIITSVRR